MGGLFLKLKLWWDSADRTQRMVSVGGAAFLVMMAVVTVAFASRPHMAMLFGGLGPTEQSSVVTELQKMGITAEYDEHGNIMVPGNQVAEARMKLASAGKLPATTGFGDEELKDFGLTTTPDVERERLKGILEGRLAETIESIDGVGSARVHIVFAQDSAFVRDAKPATASVTITEAATASLSKEQGQAIASLVANSTPQLSINNVVVLNNKMEMLFDGSDGNTASGKVSSKIAAQISEGKRRESELQSMLDEVYGPGATIAKVNVELDYDEKSTVVDTAKPRSATQAQTTETMGGAKPGLAGGAATLGVQAPAAVGGSTPDKTYSRETTQNAVSLDTTHTDTKFSSGDVKSISVDVIANDAKVTDEAGLRTLGSIVDGYLGLPAPTAPPKAGDTTEHNSQGNIQRTVTKVTFDTSAAAAAAKATSSAGGAARIQQFISLLPIVALLVVGVMVMKSIGKISKGSIVALSGGGSLPLPYQPSSLPGGGSVGGGGSIQPGMDILTNYDGPTVESGQDDASLGSIKGISRKVNVPLEQIRKMSDDRPEAVAMLIKGWLLEESR